MRTPIALAAILLAGQPALADEQAAIPLVPHGSSAQAQGTVIDLGEADDPVHPRSWQGPLSITAPAGTRCTASSDVAIIEQPMALLRGHLLYLSTYSGSAQKLFVVETKTCNVTWSSPPFTGRVAIGDHSLLLSNKRFEIGPAGLPR